MNFETEYKNINFHISLENILITDTTLLLGDKFNRLPAKTKQELKKGNIVAFNLIIISTNNSEKRTHYWSNVLLTSNHNHLLDQLGSYLDEEEILDLIIKNWNLLGDEAGPAWMQQEQS